MSVAASTCVLTQFSLHCPRHVLGGPNPDDRTALAMATASRHPAIAMAVATSGVNPERRDEFAIVLLYFVVATMFDSLPEAACAPWRMIEVTWCGFPAGRFEWDSTITIPKRRPRTTSASTVAVVLLALGALAIVSMVFGAGPFD